MTTNRWKILVLVVFALALLAGYFVGERKRVSPTVGPVSTTCSGVTVNPANNLQNLVNSNPAGTTFCIQPGVHRDMVTPKSGDVFTGLAGAVENGAMPLTNWQRVVVAGTPYWTTPGRRCSTAPRTSVYVNLATQAAISPTGYTRTTSRIPAFSRSVRSPREVSTMRRTG